MTKSGTTPYRHDSVTTPCPTCGSLFPPVGRQLFCSGACRSLSYRLRKKISTPLAVVEVPTPSRPRTIYWCEVCDTRTLGDQRCEECGHFMRRIGIGGLCPCCDEPVAAIELVPEIQER